MSKNAMLHTKTAIFNRDLAYSDAVLIWQRSLTNDLLRTLAEDYRRGIRDPSTIDAHAEFLRRGLNRVEKGPTVGLPRCDQHQRGRYPFSCDACKARREALLAEGQEALPEGESIDDPIEGSQAITDAPDALLAYSHA